MKCRSRFVRDLLNWLILGHLYFVFFEAVLSGAEYVIVRELAHFHEEHQTPEFWLLLERAMLEFVRRKTWLAVPGVDVEGI
jgi:predicted metal-dependent hydrolase